MVLLCAALPRSPPFHSPLSERPSLSPSRTSRSTARIESRRTLMAAIAVEGGGGTVSSSFKLGAV